MPWTFSVATDIGSRSEQQDCLDILHSKNGQRHLIVLADGMGGLQNGALAAQTLIDVATQHFAAHDNTPAYPFLQTICLAAHHAINELQHTAESTSGTTAVLLYIEKQRATWLHVGDSRLYHFHQGNLLTHTNDHSLRQLMLTQGLIDEGSTAAKATQNQLYRRLGGDQPPEPDFNSAEIKDGDSFLLCSDGFWQAIPASEIMPLLKQSPPNLNKAHYLVDLARQRSGNHCDNISLAIAQWQAPTAQSYWHKLVNIFHS